MRRKKILYDEILIQIFTDGSISIDGLNEFCNGNHRAEIMRVFRQVSIGILKGRKKQKEKTT